ncbi:hypothetical protein FACS1894113_4610 [Alphaproteobacteria bacterium]|nr:hypothetical protein FACS1894113_4610 [Alphaproteobacteria bacterium]
MMNGLAPRFIAASSIDASKFTNLAFIVTWTYAIDAIMCPITTVRTPLSFGQPMSDSENMNSIKSENPTMISGTTIGMTVTLFMNVFPKNLLLFELVTAVKLPRTIDAVADIIAISRLVMAALSNSSFLKTDLNHFKENSVQMPGISDALNEFIMTKNIGMYKNA